MRTFKLLTSPLAGACFSSFDPEAFLATHVEGQMETKFTPLPEADYNAYVDKIEAAEMGKSGNKRKVLVVTFAITDESAKAFMQMDKPTVKHNVFLDFEEDGRLSFGKNKNVALGALREAVGQNGPEPWSFRRLEGAGPVVIKLTHRFNTDTGEGPYANVARVAKPGAVTARAA